MLKIVFILFAVIVAITTPEGAIQTAQEGLKYANDRAPERLRGDLELGRPITWYKISYVALEVIADEAYSDPRDVGYFMGFIFPILHQGNCLGSINVLPDTVSKNGYRYGGGSFGMGAIDKSQTCIARKCIRKNPDSWNHEFALLDGPSIDQVIAVDSLGNVFVVGAAQELTPLSDVKEEWAEKAKKELRFNRSN